MASLPTSCPMCGASLAPALPGVVAIRCFHCGAHFVDPAGVGFQPANLAVGAPRSMTGPLRSPRDEVPSSELAGLTSKEDALRIEIEREVERLREPTLVRRLTYGLLIVGASALVIGGEASCSDGHVDIRDELRTARLSDPRKEAIPLTLLRDGQRLTVAVRAAHEDSSAHAPTDEGFTAERVEDGYRLVRVEPGSDLAAAGVRVGDTAVRVGDQALVVRASAMLPILAGALLLTAGIVVLRRRSRRLRRLRASQRRVAARRDQILAMP